MDNDLNRFYEESIMFNWEMLQTNPDYYLGYNAQSTFQKIDELYDLYLYFIEKQNYEACIIIKFNLDILTERYKTELHNKGVI